MSTANLFTPVTPASANNEKQTRVLSAAFLAMATCLTLGELASAIPEADEAKQQELLARKMEAFVGKIMDLYPDPNLMLLEAVEVAEELGLHCTLMGRIQ